MAASLTTSTARAIGVYIWYLRMPGIWIRMMDGSWVWDFDVMTCQSAKSVDKHEPDAMQYFCHLMIRRACKLQNGDLR
jgi:hypothetical protein